MFESTCEIMQASFDQYLDDKSRVLKALCPYEKRKHEQINEVCSVRTYVLLLPSLQLFSNLGTICYPITLYVQFTPENL